LTPPTRMMIPQQCRRSMALLTNNSSSKKIGARTFQTCSKISKTVEII
jgi:hypothetical protein